MRTMKKHKVLFVIESLAGGGAEKVLTTLLRHLDYDRFDVGLLAIVDTGPHKAQVPAAVRYYSALNISESIWYKFKYNLIYRFLPLGLVYRWLVPDGYDVVVSFLEGFVTKLVSAGPSSQTKVAWVHTDLLNHHHISAWYRNNDEERRSYRRFKTVCCVSDVARESFLQLYGRDINALTLYNPVDSIEILEKSREEITDIDVTRRSGVVRLCSVGRLVPQKAFGRLVRIAGRLIASGHDIELWILGEGGERAELEAYIRDRNLGDRIRLMGFQANPYKYMAQADLFVCSSVAEGYSTAVSEALILGLGVVTTDCAGMREMLGDNEYGIIAENNEESLEEALRSVLSDGRVGELRRRADDRRGLFDISRRMAEIEKILTD